MAVKFNAVMFFYFFLSLRSKARPRFSINIFHDAKTYLQKLQPITYRKPKSARMPSNHVSTCELSKRPSFFRVSRSPRPKLTTVTHAINALRFDRKVAPPFCFRRAVYSPVLLVSGAPRARGEPGFFVCVCGQILGVTRSSLHLGTSGLAAPSHHARHPPAHHISCPLRASLRAILPRVPWRWSFWGVPRVRVHVLLGVLEQ